MIENLPNNYVKDMHQKTFLWNPMQSLLERKEMKQNDKNKNYIIFNMNQICSDNAKKEFGALKGK